MARSPSRHSSCADCRLLDVHLLFQGKTFGDLTVTPRVFVGDNTLHPLRTASNHRTIVPQKVCPPQRKHLAGYPPKPSVVVHPRPTASFSSSKAVQKEGAFANAATVFLLSPQSQAQRFRLTTSSIVCRQTKFSPFGFLSG